MSEISIQRRLDRAGEGEYRLNGARCRLVDVIEVLSDTGLGKEMHSVISQGRVESIVTSKPRDRRLLLEEAAGLGKHRKRRRRAQLKLERTQENLDRALDVEREGLSPRFQARLLAALAAYGIDDLAPGERLVSAAAAAPTEVVELSRRAFFKTAQEKPQACLKLLMGICSNFGQKVTENRDALRALLGVLQTPLATLWVWLAFAEQPATATLAGGAIVLVAVVADMLAPHATSTTSRDSIRSGSPA